MKQSDSYLHLLIKMSAVLVVVLAVSVYNGEGSTGARAGEDGKTAEVVVSAETGYAGGNTASANIVQADPLDSSMQQDHGSGEGAGTDEDDAQKAVAGEGDTAEDDEYAIQYDDAGVIAGDDFNAGESSGSEEKYVFKELISNGSITVSNGSISWEHDDPDDPMRYIETLLVTDPAHYNEEVVSRALELPTGSDNDRYRYITGADKRTYTVGDMPAGFRNDAEASRHMVTIDVPVWKMKSNGEKYADCWPLTLHENLVDSARCIFSDIFLLDIKFPFNYLSGYKYRKVGGVGLVNSKLMSTHAFGVALDINMGDYDNDYFLGKGNDLRNKKNPYCIPDEVIEIFEKYGWFWGGNYDICADTMHFQYYELGFLQYENDEPFPVLYIDAKHMNGNVVRNLTQRLVRLGYLSTESTVFDQKVDNAVKRFQMDHGLEADGKVNYATWEPLINLTHDMSYVF